MRAVVERMGITMGIMIGATANIAEILTTASIGSIEHIDCDASVTAGLIPLPPEGGVLARDGTLPSGGSGPSKQVPHP